MRVSRRRGAARAGVALAFTCAATGCGLIAGVDFDKVHLRGSGGGGGGDAGPADAGADGPTDAGPTCDASVAAYDAVGCLCDKEGVVQSCYQGVPGMHSGCNTPGSQFCQKQGSDLVWGPCVGGSTASAEVCFDGIDNDCDGEIDNGCPCSSGADLCAGLDGGDHAVVPTSAKLGTKIDTFVLSTQSLVNVSLLVNGNYCAGSGGVTGFCAMSAACTAAGWKAYYQQVTLGTPPFSAGTATLKYDLNIPDPGQNPCTSPQRSVTATLQVTP